MAKSAKQGTFNTNMFIKPSITLLSAAATESILYPIDSVKTWSQTTKRKPHIKTSLQHYNYVISQAYRRGGFRSFYQGLNLSIARNSLSTAAVLGFGKNVNTKLSYFTKMGILTPTLTKVCSSFIVSITANGMLVPVEMIKTRLQADGRKPVDVRRYTGTFNAGANFIKRNGIKALWNGSAPMLFRSTCWWMTSIPAYNGTKSLVRDYMPLVNINNNSNSNTNDKINEEDTIVHVIASFVSGLTATICSHPFDLVRVKLVNQPTQNPKYNCMSDCFFKTVEMEGIFGLYKGFLPRYSRLGPWQLLFWCVYEKTLVLATGENFSWD
eukprot:g910.t1